MRAPRSRVLATGRPYRGAKKRYQKFAVGAITRFDTVLPQSRKFLAAGDISELVQPEEFEMVSSRRHPEDPRSHQRGEGSPASMQPSGSNCTTTDSLPPLPSLLPLL